MITELWEKIEANQEVRQNLSKLRQVLKEDRAELAFRYHIAGREDKLVTLLKHEDPKTRKNTVLLMGTLGCQEFLAPIYQAYQSEEQMFVKSAYLTAMKNFDYREYLEALKERMAALQSSSMAREEEKHGMAELRELSSLVVTAEGVKMHEFIGQNRSHDIILLTNRNFQSVTMDKLTELEPGAQVKQFGAGVMARVNHLNWMEEIRTYQELLFMVKGMAACPMDAEKAAEIIVHSELLAFLKANHKGKPPFYFRIEFKSKMDLDKRSAFSKKLAGQIEKLSDRNLINTTSRYEIEIRLIENKEGGCNVLVKLFTLKDERFTYRSEVISASIKPSNAALTVALAGKHLREDARILDPFCGVGTMLMERYKAVRSNTAYGIDIQSEAIEKARKNTEAARQIIHYINRDFFDFKHEYRFDEVITNMPFRIGRKTEEEIYGIYESFFPAVKRCLEAGGIIVLYTHNKEYVDQFAGKSGFRILEEFEISKREGTWVIVLQSQ